MPQYKKECMISFMKEGILDTIENIDEFLSKCRTKQQRGLLLCLFLTGARPSELIELRGEDVWKERDKIFVRIKTKKGGRMRIFPLPYKNKYVQMFWDYVNNLLPPQKLFWKFKSSVYVRQFIYKVTDNKYTPYFFRHNRFTLMSMKGASPELIKYLKGAKTLLSVEPYIHVSKHELSKATKFL